MADAIAIPDCALGDIMGDGFDIAVDMIAAEPDREGIRSICCIVLAPFNFLSNNLNSTEVI